MDAKKSETMTPNEKFEALQNLRKRLDEDFIQIGQLLHEIKAGRLWKMKGYDSFKEFVENQQGFGNTMANKLIKLYEVYVVSMNLSAEELKEIGLEKLSVVANLVGKPDEEGNDIWLEKAKQCDLSELNAEVKAERKRRVRPDYKEVLISQWAEMGCELLNCNKKDFLFKMALYFQDSDWDEVRKQIKIKQRKFEQEMEANGQAGQKSMDSRLHGNDGEVTNG
jgi:hypothetical protein